MTKLPATSFPVEVAKQLGFYVYRLLDPRNGETFYIGKGKGNRVFEHAAGTLKLATIDDESEEDAMSLKMRRIIEIKDAGLRVWLIKILIGINGLRCV